MEKIYEVRWCGPYTEKTLNSLTAEENDKFVLYKIYGSHPVYGNNILLYIGMTEQNIEKRINQHGYWMDEARFGSSTMYFASAGHFQSWKDSESTQIYDKLDREYIEKIEALLIYAHQPVHNSKARNSAENSREIRLFNTGSFGILMPEISGKYQNC